MKCHWNWKANNKWINKTKQTKHKKKKSRKQVLKTSEDPHVCWTLFIKHPIASWGKQKIVYWKVSASVIENIMWKTSLFTRSKGDWLPLLNFGPVKRAYALPHRVISSKGCTHAIWIINRSHSFLFWACIPGKALLLCYFLKDNSNFFLPF